MRVVKERAASNTEPPWIDYLCVYGETLSVLCVSRHSEPTILWISIPKNSKRAEETM